MSVGVNLHKTHPSLFRSAITFALISVSLGLNFIFTKPTFLPYNIPKEAIGAAFLALGMTKLISLLFIRNLKFIRLNMAASVALMQFWGIGTSLTFFTGQTSLQLFCLYAGISVLQVIWCLEPFINPATGTNGKL